MGSGHRSGFTVQRKGEPKTLEGIQSLCLEVLMAVGGGLREQDHLGLSRRRSGCGEPVMLVKYVSLLAC